MQIDLYKSTFEYYFGQESLRASIQRAVTLLDSARRILFLGNGGSNAIASHMMEDFMKIAGKPTLSFSDAALITCFANDYGYEHAMAKWIDFQYQDGDILVAISSSGESANILNAVHTHKKHHGKVITLSGFKAGNTLSTLGDINFEISDHNYGIVECFHQVILHAILDELA